MSRKLRSANPNVNPSDAQGYHEHEPPGGLTSDGAPSDTGVASGSPAPAPIKAGTTSEQQTVVGSNIPAGPDGYLHISPADGSEEPALLTEAAARRNDVPDANGVHIQQGAPPPGGVNITMATAGTKEPGAGHEPGQDRPASTFLARTAAIAPLELERVDWVARLPPGVSVEQVEADLADWGRR
jgi:hypothetical protein